MLTVDILIEKYDNAINTITTDIEVTFDKQWEARADVVRNVVSIAAIVFAGSAAFLEKGRQPHFKTLEGASLITTWILLLISIGAGLYVLYKSVELRTFRAMLINKKPYLIEQFKKLNLAAPGCVQESVVLVKQVADDITAAVALADNRARLAMPLCLCAFALSMVSFLVYALARFVA
jgi:hypothetical protein